MSGTERREIDALLFQLDRDLRQAFRTAAEAQRVGVSDSLARYRKFREEADEFQALVAVLRDRLHRLAEEITPEMRRQVDQADAQMVVLMIKTSGYFFDSFAKSKEIPMGTHEICSAALRSIEELGERLGGLDYVGANATAYTGERVDALQSEVVRIVAVLRAILDKAFSLPSFDHRP